MNTAGAAAGGIGALIVGLGLLAYQVGTWVGFSDRGAKLHFVSGLTIAALLLLGGGILGAMGGATAALGDGVGKFALESAVDVTASGGGRPASTGGERVGVGGAAFGVVLLLFYLGCIKSGREEMRSPLIRGALVGVFLGSGAGLIGMAVGLIKTSGNTIGEVMVGVF